MQMESLRLAMVETQRQIRETQTLYQQSLDDLSDALADSTLPTAQIIPFDIIANILSFLCEIEKKSWPSTVDFGHYRLLHSDSDKLCVVRLMRSPSIDPSWKSVLKRHFPTQFSYHMFHSGATTVSFVPPIGNMPWPGAGQPAGAAHVTPATPSWQIHDILESDTEKSISDVAEGEEVVLGLDLGARNARSENLVPLFNQVEHLPWQRLSLFRIQPGFNHLVSIIRSFRSNVESIQHLDVSYEHTGVDLARLPRDPDISTDIVGVSDPFAFHSLETMSFLNYVWIFGEGVFPKLKTLTLFNVNNNSHYFHRLPPSLTSLTLTNLMDDVVDASSKTVDTAPNLPCLKNLAIIHPSLHGVVNLLERLQSDSLESLQITAGSRGRNSWLHPRQSKDWDHRKEVADIIRAIAHFSPNIERLSFDYYNHKPDGLSPMPFHHADIEIGIPGTVKYPIPLPPTLDPLLPLKREDGTLEYPLRHLKALEWKCDVLKDVEVLSSLEQVVRSRLNTEGVSNIQALTLRSPYNVTAGFFADKQDRKLYEATPEVIEPIVNTLRLAVPEFKLVGMVM